MADVKSGTYQPNNSVKLTVWAEETDPPEGYELIRNADGSRIAVAKDRGDIKRDREGTAYSIPEGGALVEYPDGRVEALVGDALEDFARRYLPSDSGSHTATTGTVNGPSGTGQTADPSTPSPVDSSQTDPNAGNPDGTTPEGQ